MIYSKLKILYIWEHDVSMGDSFTNFHIHLSAIRDKHPSAIIYSIVHPRTYNTGVTNIFLLRGLIDYVLPLQIQEIKSPLYSHYRKILKNIDVVIHVNHSSLKSVNILRELYPSSIHLQTQESNFGLTSVEEYCNIYGNESDKLIKKSFHTDYVEQFKIDVISMAENKKMIGIFAGSSRPLANLGCDGIQKIMEIARKHNIYTYLIGTSTFNIYDVNNIGVKWEGISNIDVDDSCNLVGNNWFKTISVMKNLDLIISGPTGASLISPIINMKSIVILGGDTTIMDGCLNIFTDRSYTSNINCKCVNYPCELLLEKQDIDKYNGCYSNGYAECLNNGINIDDIELKLKEL